MAASGRIYPFAEPSGNARSFSTADIAECSNRQAVSPCRSPVPTLLSSTLSVAAEQIEPGECRSTENIPVRPA
jgi:hypothetical protein